MLATDAHGGQGGIAQYNRDVLGALAQSKKVERVWVLSRFFDHATNDVPTGIAYKEASGQGLARFLVSASGNILQACELDLVYAAHINLLPVAAMIAKMRRLPLLLAIYGIEAWKPPSRRSARWAATLPDRVMSISEVTLGRFIEWSQFPRSRTSICPNAIHLEQYGMAEKSAELVKKYRLEGRTVIMTLGRMAASERYKGFDEIIELMPRLRDQIPGIAYLAVGDGDDRNRLTEKARALGVVDDVIFAGYVSEGEKAAHYRLADAYVMPSYGEGFGFVVLEALACGVPVVASEADGTREAARNGELGLLVRPGDEDALLAAILETVSAPRQIPDGLGYFGFPEFARRVEETVGLAAARQMRAVAA